MISLEALLVCLLLSFKIISLVGCDFPNQEHPLSCRYSFGLGYGLSMTANAGLAPLVAKIQRRTGHQVDAEHPDKLRYSYSQGPLRHLVGRAAVCMQHMEPPD